MSQSLLCIMVDKTIHWMYFTELWIISHGKDRKGSEKSHGIFCNLKSVNPGWRLLQFSQNVNSTTFQSCFISINLWL